jgi:hypothetical protein
MRNLKLMFKGMLFFLFFLVLSSCKKENPLSLKGVETFIAFDVWVKEIKPVVFTSESGEYTLTMNRSESEFFRNTAGDFRLSVNNQSIAFGRWSADRSTIYLGNQNLTTPSFSYYAIVKVEILSNNSFKLLEVEEHNDKFPGAPEFPFFNNVTYVLTPQ